MGRVNKPITAVEKRQMRELLKQLRQRMIEERKATRGVTHHVVADEGIVDKAQKVVKSMNFVTPSALAEKLGVDMGLAKRILRDLENRGVLKLYSRNRRIQIYVPAGKEGLVQPGAYSYTVKEM